MIKEEQNESESNKIFNGDDVDQKPSFPGGNKALINLLHLILGILIWHEC